MVLKKTKSFCREMSKEKKEPPNIDELIAKVAEVIGAQYTRDQIRKELAHRGFNVLNTTSAFLDSEAQPKFFFFFFFFFFFPFFLCL